MYIKNLWERFKGSGFWKSIVTLSAGQIIALSINIFTIPIISRIYSKEAFGDFAIVTSTATIIIGFIGLGLGSAIMMPKSDEESEEILVSSLLIQIFLLIAVTIVMFILMPYYKIVSSELPYIVAIMVMFIYIILTVISSLMSVYINRLKMDKVLFINPLIGALLALCLKIPLGLMGFDSVGLYIATITSLILVNIHMIRNANPFKKKINLSGVFCVLKKYKDFVIYQYPANLMGIFTSQMPNQLLGRNFGSSALGDYSMNNSVFAVPSGLLASPIQTIYFRTVSQRYRDGEDIADFTYSLITKLMIVSSVPIIAIMAFGEEIFAFVLGAQWASAGILASLLALQYLFSFLYNCITYCRVAINKQRVNLFTSVFQFVFIIASLIFGVIFFNTLLGTIACFAVANLIYQIINISITFFCLKKHAIKFLLFSILFCLASITIAFMLKSSFT